MSTPVSKSQFGNYGLRYKAKVLSLPSGEANQYDHAINL
jgi:hypothetical protein